MKNVKKIISLFFISVILILNVGCTKDAEKSSEITLTDALGRTVTLEKEANRIVSCYYVTTYAAISLGISDRLVGIEKKADTRPIYSMANPGLLSLPSVGSLKEISIETIVSLSPDLVILPKKLSSEIDTLDDVGIKSLVVNPETYDGLCQMLTLIATACGVPEKAESLISYYNEKLNGFTPKTDKPTALVLGNSDYLTAAPGNMYQNDLIALSGAANGFSDNVGDSWTKISYETLISIDPDYLILPSNAAYTADTLKNDAELSTLRAVKNGNVISFPSTFEEWDSPIPSCVLGVLWLRAKLYPDIYSQESFKKDLISFYETFYSFSPNKASVDSLF